MRKKLGSSPGFALDLLCGPGQAPAPSLGLSLLICIVSKRDLKVRSQEHFPLNSVLPSFLPPLLPLLPPPSSLSAQSRGEGTCLDHSALAGVSMEEGAWGRKGLTHLLWEVSSGVIMRTCSAPDTVSDASHSVSFLTMTL